MASKAFYMPFFTKDYLSSSTVLKMSMAAQGIYLRLLFINWEEGFLDATDDELPRLAGATPEEWDQFEKYLDRCFPRDGDYRSNRRVTYDRNESIAFIEGQSKAGREGAMKRWHGKCLPNRPAIGSPIGSPLGRQSDGNANPMLSNPIQSNPPEIKVKGATRASLWARLSPFLPSEFDTEPFRNSIAEYEQFRKEKKFPAYTETTVKKIASQWSTFTPEEVIEAFDKSISAGYQGCFPKKKTQPKGNFGEPDPPKIFTKAERDAMKRQQENELDF